MAEHTPGMCECGGWHAVDDLREQELGQLRAVGDTLQSEGSRLAEWAASIADGALSPSTGANVPYEVRNAIWEIERAVEQWTMIRSGSKVTGPPAPRITPTARLAPCEPEAEATPVKQVDRKPGPCPHDKPAYQWCDKCHG
jgi:hypothetical protein